MTQRNTLSMAPINSIIDMHDMQPINLEVGPVRSGPVKSQFGWTVVNLLNGYTFKSLMDCWPVCTATRLGLQSISALAIVVIWVKNL